MRDDENQWSGILDFAMDIAYFGFRENPFVVAPDPRFFYTNHTYQQAYATLLAGIRERKGFLLLIGEEGTGKTTLLRQVMAHVETLVGCFLIDCTELAGATFDQVLRSICLEIGLPHDQDRHLQKLQTLGAYLATRSQAGGTTVLFMDEAHALTDEVLGNLRSLSPPNMTGEKPLLQIVLVGQPELERKLAQPKLRPLKQRMALQCWLDGLEEREVALFIQHRLHTVGCERQDLFTPEAIQRIARYSQGVPRLINIICDNALLTASGASQQKVSAATVDEVVRISPLLREAANRSQDIHQEAVALRTAPLLHPSPDQGLIDRGAASEETARARFRLPVLSSAALLLLLVGGLLYYSKRTTPILPLPRSKAIDIIRLEPDLPPGQALVLAEGQKLTFAIDTASDQPASLQYAWFLNGREQAYGTRWTYEPQFDEGSLAPKTVTVRVTNLENRSIERSWQVRVEDRNRSPVLTAFSPPLSTVQINPGQEQQFSIAVTDADTDDELTYTWTVDGQEVARSQSWSFTPPSAPAKGEHAVAVTVSDRAGGTLEKQWTVTIAPAPPQPPVIAQATPTDREVTVMEGQKLAFAIEAASAQAQPLQYGWFLDGQERAQGPRWTYQPQFEEGDAKPKEVTVQVTDQERRLVERTWRVFVQDVNRPPIIKTTTPSARTLTLAADTEQQFSIQATDPDKDDRVNAVWSLDGREVGKGQNWRFRAPPTLAANQPHQVRVEIVDKGGLKNRFIWNIVVTPPTPRPPVLDAQPEEEPVTPRIVEPAVPPPTPVSPPVAVAARPPAATAPPVSLSVEEVRTWLETQRRALEEKDVDRLVALGAMERAQSERARDILARYQSFRVTLQDVEIRISGKTATVSFSRVDTIDGKPMPHPERKTFLLEKDANGRLKARAQ